MPELQEFIRRQIVKSLRNDTALLAKTRHREMKAVIPFGLAVSVRDAGHKTREPTPMTRQMISRRLRTSSGTRWLKVLVCIWMFIFFGTLGRATMRSGTWDGSLSLIS